MSKSHEYTDRFSKTLAKRSITLNDPSTTFDPTYVDVPCVTLPKDHGNTSKYVDIVTIFQKN